MSDVLLDLLRADPDGIDEGVGDDMLSVEDLEEDEKEEKSEKLRFDLFNDTYLAIEPNTEAKEAPTKGSWVLPVIYKKSAMGHNLRWQIGFNAISKKLLWTVGRVETEGLRLFSLDVVPTKAQKGVYTAKAYRDALQKYSLKLKNGFHRDVGGSSALPIPLPMLANKYEPQTDESAGNVPHMPIAAQVKYDGERHIVFLDPRTGVTKTLSRQMNHRPHFDHIREEAGRLLTFLPPGSILDGELYSVAVGFQDTTKIAGTKTDRHPREKELDYYLFDVFHPETVWRPGIAKEVKAAHTGDGDRGFVYARASGYTVEDYATQAREYVELPQDDSGSESLTCSTFAEILDGSPMWVVEVRISLLMNAFRCYRIKFGEWPRYVKLVKTWILHDRADILKLFSDVRVIKIPGPEKLEGIMLRHLSRGDSDPTKSLYRPNRSDNLLKVKALQSTEVIITGVRSGRGEARDLATLVYREPGTGLVGTMLPAVTHEERRNYLLNPKSVIGRTMTVSYQNRMVSGKMRFPVGVAFVN